MGRIRMIKRAFEILPVSGGFKRLTAVLPLLVLTIFLPVSGPGVTAAGEGLTPWIELAMENNQGYQLALREYELGIKELRLAKKKGLTSSEIAVYPAASGIFESSNRALIRYSGRLPGEVTFSGSGLLLDTGEENRLEASLKLELNPVDLAGESDDPATEAAYLIRKSNLYQTGVEVIQKVVSGYYRLLKKELELQLLAKKKVLQQNRLRAANTRLARGVISPNAFQEMEVELENLQIAGERCERERAREVEIITRLGGSDLPEGLLTTGNVFLRSPDNFQAVTACLEEGLPLATGRADRLLTDWDPRQTGDFLEQTYAYQQAGLNLRQAEAELRELEEEDAWGVSLAAQVDYREELVISGAVNISRSFYNPAGRLKIKKARLRLEKAELSLDETKSELLTELNSQVVMIEELQQAYQRSTVLFKKGVGQLERVELASRQGLISDNELLGEKIKLLEQLISLIELQEELIKARLRWGQTLSLEEFEHQGYSSLE